LVLLVVVVLARSLLPQAPGRRTVRVVLAVDLPSLRSRAPGRFGAGSAGARAVPDPARALDAALWRWMAPVSAGRSGTGWRA